MRELLLYGGIFEFSAASFIQNVERTPINTGIVLRVNSPGGNPDMMWGMIAKFKEYTGNKKVKVDGQAQSAAFFFLLFSDEVEAIKQSTLMVHRAASFFEDDIPEVKEQVRKRNQDLREAFEAKIDVSAFERVAGITVERLFDTDEPQVDVILTAAQGQEIGLISEVVDLSPQELLSLNKSLIAAQAQPIEVEEQKTESPMTLQELKDKHPQVYNDIFAQGQEAGIKAEQDRVAAWMAFNDVDPKAVAEGIESKDAPSLKEMAELTRKSVSASGGSAQPEVSAESDDSSQAEDEKDAKELEASSAKDIKTEATKTPASGSDDQETEISKFEAASRGVLNLESKN